MSTTGAHTADLKFFGARARIVARGEDTDGRLGMVDMLDVPAGDMPPLHVHRDTDEGFHVLEGDLTLYMPGAERRLRAGDYFLAPRGVPHAYRVGDEGCRVVVTSLPAGFERFVVAVSEMGEPDPARLTELAAEHDIDILGPPGTLP